MELPSQEEQDEAEYYVLQRPLNRPDITYKKAVIYVLVYILSAFTLAFISFRLFSRFGIFLSVSEKIALFFQNNEPLFKLLYYLAVFLLIAMILARKAVIMCVQLYQHYAPEDVRRRCLFKPTCSEYTILAVKKYGVVIGLIKAYKRLFLRCRGNIYQIDYP